MDAEAHLRHVLVLDVEMIPSLASCLRRLEDDCRSDRIALFDAYRAAMVVVVVRMMF